MDLRIPKAARECFQARADRLDKALSAAQQSLDDAFVFANEAEALRKDAELWRFFLSTRPPETHAVIVESMIAAMGEKA
jgi:hypothetical protein